MGFKIKTWKDRKTEYPNRRMLTKEDGTKELVTVSREEGIISEEGDAFSAENMNDLEKRIEEVAGTYGDTSLGTIATSKYIWLNEVDVRIISQCGEYYCNHCTNCPEGTNGNGYLSVRTINDYTSLEFKESSGKKWSVVKKAGVWGDWESEYYGAIGNDKFEYAENIVMWHNQTSVLLNNKLHLSFGIKVSTDIAAYSTIATITEGYRGGFNSAVTLVPKKGGSVYGGYYNCATGMISTFDYTLPIGDYIVMSS